MERWRLFEINALEYLKSKIKIPGIELVGTGGSDSTSPDIGVMSKNEFGFNKNLFSIESKFSPSQCGQIVVILKNGKYVFSDLSKDKDNPYTEKIVDKLNLNLKRYGDPGSTAIEIDNDAELFRNWVCRHYENMGVRFILTSKYYENLEKKFVKIVPLKEMGANFEITAVLRRKKSGSQKIPPREIPYAKKLLEKIFPQGFSIDFEGRVIINPPFFVNKVYLGDEKRYYLPKNGAIIRKLSTTNNPNVVFSTRYIGKEESSGLDLLIEEIKKSL